MTRNTIRSSEEAAAVLSGMSLVGLAPRPVDLLPLLRLGALRRLATCEAPDTGWTDRFGVEAFSLEGRYRMRRRWRTANLDDLLPHLPLWLGTPDGAERSVLVPYGPTDHWPSAPSGAFHQMTPPAMTCSAGRPDLHDKIAVRRWLAALGVPIPASRAVPAERLDFRALSAQLGAPFVLQQPTGSAGSGTYLVTDEAEVQRIRHENLAVPVWLASEYVGDTTLNLHGLVTANGEVVISQPSLQLTNLPQVGAGFGEYCGSDLAAPALLPSAPLAACRAVVERIGAGLARLNYRGLFGVDIALYYDAVSVLEINGRVQASTWLLGDIEMEQGGLPLLVRHVLELAGQPTAGEPTEAPIAGAQLVIRHTGSSGTVTAVPDAGRYRYRGGRLCWSGIGLGLADCGDADVVAMGLPRPGVGVTSGAPIGRLVTRRPLVASDGQTLQPDVAGLVEAFRAALTITPYEQTCLTAPAVPHV